MQSYWTLVQYGNESLERWNNGILECRDLRRIVDRSAQADEYRRYLQNPELLRAEISARKSVGQVVMDEVQKVPNYSTTISGASARLCKIIRESSDLPVEVSAAFLAPHTATGGRVDLPNAEGIDNSTTVTLEALQPTAPAELPGDTEHVGFRSGLRVHIGAGVEFDRVVSVDW